MNLHEAIGLLGLVEAHNIIAGGDYNTVYTSKDVEKCFRQQALRHHPDKGGDASHFQLLHQAKDMLLDHNAGNTMAMGSASNYCRTSCCDANNSTAVNTSLYKHRTCIRQVLMVHDGKRKTVIAATDDGLTVIELKKDATGGLERVVSFTTHRDDCSFLCCTTAVPSSSNDDDDDDNDDYYVVNVLYAGAKDGFVHKIELSTRRLTSSWQLPSRERIVAISGLRLRVRDWVGIATADGGIYMLEYQNGASTPTMVWKCRVGSAGKWAARRQKTTTCVTMTPETILLEEGSNSDCLNLWVGGSSSSSDTVTGRLVMWELDTHEDLFEQYNNDDDDVEDLFGEYGIYESDTDSNTSKEPHDCSHDDKRNATLAIDVTVQEGPIFSLSKHKRSIAVTAGQCIMVWDYNNNSNNSITNPHHQSGKKKKLTKIKTIQTNNQTLYTLCMNRRFVAAAGSGESIMVWDRDLWTMVHYLPLQRSPLGCCLATNCIMTLDWFRGDDSGILVSGGYDGVVTMWTLANRLGSNDDTTSRGI
jgi:WD40 repeat protein